MGWDTSVTWPSTKTEISDWTLKMCREETKHEKGTRHYAIFMLTEKAKAVDPNKKYIQYIYIYIFYNFFIPPISKCVPYNLTQNAPFLFKWLFRGCWPQWPPD